MGRRRSLHATVRFMLACTLTGCAWSLCSASADEILLALPGRGNVAVNLPDLERLVFGAVVREGALRKLDFEVQVRVTNVEQSVGALSDSQRNKLFLAAQADVQRFLTELEQTRAQAPVAAAEAISYEQYAQYIARCQALRKRLESGLHGDGSLFMKTFASTLTAEQVGKIKDSEYLEREQFFLEGVVLLIETMRVRAKLTVEQERQLAQLLLPAAQPLLRARVLPRTIQQHQTACAMYVLFLLPEETLQTLASEEQMKILAIYRTQGSSCESVLRQRGILPPEVPR